MSIIPNKLSFIWVGAPMPKKYLANTITWAVQNPVYEVHLWTETRTVKEYAEALIEEYKVHPQTVSQANITVDETSLGVRIDFHRGSVTHLQLFVNSIFTIEAICDPMILAEELEGWKNYGAASDILRVWVLYTLGGIYMDCDTFPVAEPIPLHITAPRDILFSNAPDVTSVCLVNCIIASAAGNPQLRRLSVSMATAYLDSTPDLIFDRHTVYSSGVRKMLRPEQQRMEVLQRAREKRAKALKKGDEEVAFHYRNRIGQLISFQTMTRTGPKRIRTWIGEEEGPNWQHISDHSGSFFNFAEQSANEETLSYYSFQIQSGYEPTVESHGTWTM